MACACAKNRGARGMPTSYAIPPTPPAAEPEPYLLVRKDGSTEEFPSRLAAYTAKIIEGSGTIKPVAE